MKIVHEIFYRIWIIPLKLKFNFNFSLDGTFSLSPLRIKCWRESDRNSLFTRCSTNQIYPTLCCLGSWRGWPAPPPLKFRQGSAIYLLWPVSWEQKWCLPLSGGSLKYQCGLLLCLPAPAVTVDAQTEKRPLDWATDFSVGRTPYLRHPPAVYMQCEQKWNCWSVNSTISYCCCCRGQNNLAYPFCLLADF